ncbi:MAG: hypothetical protein R3C03_02665 [Pirellulaceae bacterium]
MAGAILGWWLQTPNLLLAQMQEVTLRSGITYRGLVASFDTYTTQYSAQSSLYGSKPIVLIDDGLRRVLLNVGHIANVPTDSNYRDLNFEISQIRLAPSASDGHATQLTSIGPFNEFGHRWLSILDENGRAKTFVQGITNVTPTYVEVNTLKRNEKNNENWSMRLDVKSIPPDLLLGLMRKQISDSSDPTKYWQIFDVLIEGRLFTMALDQLRLIETQFPDLKDDVERSRIQVQSLWATQILEEMRNRKAAGQFQLALALAKVFVTEGLGEEKQIEFQDFQRDALRELAEVDQIRNKVSEIVQQYISTINEPERVERLRRFLNLVETDLNLNNADRFAGFENFLASGEAKPEILVARIISRWYLGNANLTENLAVAESFIPVYELVRVSDGDTGKSPHTNFRGTQAIRRRKS